MKSRLISEHLIIKEIIDMGNGCERIIHTDLCEKLIDLGYFFETGYSENGSKKVLMEKNQMTIIDQWK